MAYVMRRFARFRFGFFVKGSAELLTATETLMANDYKDHQSSNVRGWLDRPVLRGIRHQSADLGALW